jgi:hypothetical protein
MIDDRYYDKDDDDNIHDQTVSQTRNIKKVQF